MSNLFLILLTGRVYFEVPAVVVEVGLSPFGSKLCVRGFDWDGEEICHYHDPDVVNVYRGIDIAHNDEMRRF